MTSKSRPGPLGASCLTCKRRHKKCDQRQPTCVRCENGRFECLGYNHNRKPIVHTTELEGLHQSRGQESQTPFPRPISSRHECDSRDMDDNTLTREQPEGTSAISPPSRLSISPGFKSGISGLCMSISDSTPTPVSSQARKVEDYLRLFATRSSCRSTDGPTLILRKIINFQAQSPYSPLDPLRTFFDSQWFVEYIIGQSDKLTDSWYLKPVNCPRKRLQKDAVLRLQNSNLTRWVALVGMGVLESVIKGDMSQLRLHNFWIGHIEGSLKRELLLDLAPHEARDRHSDLVHITLLKTMLIHSSNTYQVLRSVTPAFLQLAFSDPALWSSNFSLTSVPLSTILTSEAHELAYFALIDCASATAFGLPQQVEYDTTIHSSPGYYSSHQWAHSSPTEFQLVLADINACRDGSPNARDWRDIENWLLAWQSRSGEHAFTDSWMTVAWYAVQESWRLALLAYLYLAVCDTPSDDVRVQSCIKQVLQVIGTLKQREPPDANLSFFIQYLIVGICARSESHRKIVRDKLSAFNVTKLWSMRASDFVPVLDHLWHGAAAGGRPIKWSDYMRSREAVLPVLL
ncbi:unnamed protein product [Rhizoctonia solani]|uniref:Zn(2)-C6 fungal-type domain-containing protein n=1 Tax=Rhizoctonia solani TaxID=456999 RepID=A0A8H2XKQ4_9AGAM|nr:unnamed protein product [Rhizoctonia solani]